jgi:hypothetical protein
MDQHSFSRTNEWAESSQRTTSLLRKQQKQDQKIFPKGYQAENIHLYKNETAIIFQNVDADVDTTSQKFTC